MFARPLLASLAVRAALVLLFSSKLVAAPSQAAAERTFADVEGTSVKVPLHPTRVMALSEIDLDSCLALGLTPVAATNGRGQKALPYYLQATNGGLNIQDIAIVGDIGRPNMEALLRLKPDLILTSPTQAETLALLRKIAPTVVTFKNGDNWRDVFKRVASALNRDDKANAFMASYAKSLQAAKAKLAAIPGKSVSIVRWNPNGPAFMYRDAFASLVLQDMGLQRPEAQRIAGQKHSLPISFEALPIIDADWLFIGTLDHTGKAADALQEVATNPSFQRLGAVKAKHYFAVDGSKWTSIGGPLAAQSLVQEVTAMITGAK